MDVSARNVAIAGVLAFGLSLEGACSSSSASHAGESGSDDAGYVPVDGGTDGSVNDSAGMPNSADAADAASDATPTCQSFANGTVACSETCYGNCYGLNDASVADPGNHVGNCVFIATGNISMYCAPFGVTNPCSYCP